MRSAALLVCSVILFAAAGPAAAMQIAQSANAFGELPATFEGVLPCADCPGIQYQLNLFADGVYFLRMSYQERNATNDEIGRWTQTLDGTRLRLNNAGGHITPFLVLDLSTLQLLDRQGRPIDSALNYNLTRAARFEPLEPRLRMRGMYRYMADAGRFTECRTGREMPVAQQGENVALEAAYSKAHLLADQPVLATVEGRIAVHPKMDGGGTQESLVVERYISVEKDKSCDAGSGMSAALQNTYWELVQLNGRDVPDIEREPSLVLNSRQGRVAGFSGCNRFSGTYELADERLKFGPVVATKMACLEGGEVEKSYLQALQQVRSWRVRGSTLDLLNESGESVARFSVAGPAERETMNRK